MAKAKTSSLLGFLSSSRTVCSFNSFVKRKGNGIGYKDRAKNPTDVERKQANLSNADAVEAYAFVLSLKPSP
jgi:hypothetical protein